MKKRKRTLTLGHLYAVDWDDHFYADRVDSDAIGVDSPARQRVYGKLIGGSRGVLQFETCRRTDQGTPYKTCFFGILRSSITKITDLGPDPR